MMGLPQPVDDFFVLSDTFHVKPLLSHLQNNRNATLILCKEDSVVIYNVSTYKETCVSEFRLDIIMKELSKYDDRDMTKSYFMLGKQLLINWLESTFDFKKNSLGDEVYIYGENQMAYFINNCLKSVTNNEVNLIKVSEDYNKSSAVNWCRGQLVMDARRELNRKVKSFNLVEDQEYISFDIQEIVQNLLAGRVKRIMLASDQQIYGKIDRLSGEITYTHFHKDHENDDILDDIAQIAIEQGIRPILVKRSRIRQQRTIKAVISRRPYKSHEWEVA
ncbi:MAG: hypothetical protein HRT44_10470 [Bdellovibrionales bacterium]|nr:hypothetical protein [Bdellovibrionales bacterium]NQZ19664.1 hypothetical protein [Bdellovibrionales bacterium]